MPNVISTSRNIFVVALILGAFFGLATAYNQREYVDLYQTSGLTIAILGLMGFVYYKAYNRHNWARILLLVWIALGTLLEIVAPLENKPPEIIPFQFWLQAAIQLLAVGLLFSPSANQWFKSRENQHFH